MYLQRPSEEAGHPQPLTALFSSLLGQAAFLGALGISFTKTKILQHMLPSFPPQTIKTGHKGNSDRQMGRLALPWD